jgi:hypothetical protein
MASPVLGRSLTIRLKPSLQSRLIRVAKLRGTTPSEVARGALERELRESDEIEGPSLMELTKHLVGTISTTRVAAGRDARRALRRWAADRRG